MDPDEIANILQCWYKRTANKQTIDQETLTAFLEWHNLAVPQVDDDLKQAIKEEFTQHEVKAAIQEANEISAPGLSEQTIAFFKLLFLALPFILTVVIYQFIN